MERAPAHHGCDDLPADRADAIAEFRELLDGHLRSRPTDYLTAFRSLLAVEEQYHWAAVPGDFTDDFYDLACPHGAVEVTIAIGGYGRHSAIRDWSRGTWTDVTWPSLRQGGMPALRRRLQHRG
jgi:hypothetical protein